MAKPTTANKNTRERKVIKVKILTYINTLNYKYDAAHNGSHYLINGSTTYKNRGELLESIAKYHRGLYTEVNPTTSWGSGSDIESENASIKSSEASLGRGVGALENYFKNVASNIFIWVELNDQTQEVTEYQMTKQEFFNFVNLFTRVHNSSNHKEQIFRFYKTSKKMLKWFEEKAVA
jgi:hypothetical protein